MNLTALTAAELDDQLAMALRTEDRALGGRVMREYRRRGVTIPDKLYRWALGTMPEQIPGSKPAPNSLDPQANPQ